MFPPLGKLFNVIILPVNGRFWNTEWCRGHWAACKDLTWNSWGMEGWSNYSVLEVHSTNRGTLSFCRWELCQYWSDSFISVPWNRRSKKNLYWLMGTWSSELSRLKSRFVNCKNKWWRPNTWAYIPSLFFDNDSVHQKWKLMWNVHFMLEVRISREMNSL